jgi:hypothetical protein
MFLGLTREQWEKIIRGAVLAFLAAGLTAIAEFLLKQDFGAYTPVIQAFAGLILNTVKVALKL